MIDKYHELDITQSSLEQTDMNRAKPVSECSYPRCEECGDYVRHKGHNYCTVPMVLNKQTWLLTADLIADLKKEIDETREMVYDHILDEKSRDVWGNYSVEEDEVLYIAEWTDEYGHQKFPLTKELLESYKEYEKNGVLSGLKVVGEVTRKDLHI